MNRSESISKLAISLVKFNSEVILQGVGIYINCYPNYEKYDHYISQVQQLNKQKRTK